MVDGFYSLKKDYKDIIIESYIGDDILNFLKMHFTNLASNLAKIFQYLAIISLHLTIT